MINARTRFLNQTQDVTRSMYAAFQGVAETQLNILQRLMRVGANQFNQFVEAAIERVQLIGQVRDPKQYASAQVGLIKSQGRRYVDSVNDSVNIVVEVWQQYGGHLEQTARTMTDDARPATSSTIS